MASNMQKLMNARNAEHDAGQRRDIARKGTVAKRSNDGAALHPNMSDRQKAGAGSGGMGHPTPGSAPLAPLAHAYGAGPDLKTGTPAAPPVINHKSQTNADTETLGDKISHGLATLRNAVKN